MRRFSILGFTEAELGFVLAALFAGLAVDVLNDRDATVVALAGLQNAAVERDSMAREFTAYRDSVEQELERLRDSVAAVAKRSTKVPQCWERGEQREPIAEVLVLGRDLFSLDGEELTIDGLRDRFAEYLERSRSLRCRYVVRAQPTPGVDAVAQSAAVWKLRQYFDVNDRPE